eukprot:CAMPEP_0181299982 /NCGR_PEP_ID=MMETSP1101-20121128/6641_1 /TAXON_ID=46948 /ORGANISM="Rhodomonas abbreviata, Strain Caron Lab Isolate" /LENGTH=530 /DNA_ID=CAMNT_0023405177 /DNA_START=41 /DNA_END=1633 /DNA_ORIENTATION=+
MLIKTICLVSLLAFLQGKLAIAGEYDEYACSLCTSAVDIAVEGTKDMSLLEACSAQFPSKVCNEIFKGKDFTVDNAAVKQNGVHSRTVCQNHDLCASLDGEMWRTTTAANKTKTTVDTASSLDIRVSKAYGSRGYDKIRISVISGAPIESEHFSYSEQFQHRWEQYYLNSGIVSVTPGETTSFTIAGETIDVSMPMQGAGVRGVMIADPCFTSEFITCVYGKKFDMFDHSIELLNAINAHDDVHYWNILGDNFYDQVGDNSGTWFDALSKESKSKVFGSVPGNHDFWINATPKLWTKKDQLGNGFMQFYGQDVAASAANTDPAASAPYDFSMDPDAADTSAENLPIADNYFYYNQVGNVGFVGYSGAHKYADMEARFEEACAWASSLPEGKGIDTLLLLGHWNEDGDGCDEDMTVPSVYKAIAQMPACQPVAAKMKYILGHKHCNLIVEEQLGFMVGGMGMSDYQCGGTFGIPVVDTVDGQFKLYYFPVQGAIPAEKVDNYDEVLGCIKENGVSGCYHLATEWTSTAVIA